MTGVISYHSYAHLFKVLPKRVMISLQSWWTWRTSLTSCLTEHRLKSMFCVSLGLRVILFPSLLALPDPCRQWQLCDSEWFEGKIKEEWTVTMDLWDVLMLLSGSVCFRWSIRTSGDTNCVLFEASWTSGKRVQKQPPPPPLPPVICKLPFRHGRSWECGTGMIRGSAPWRAPAACEFGPAWTWSMKRHGLVWPRGSNAAGHGGGFRRFQPDDHRHRHGLLALLAGVHL